MNPKKLIRCGIVDKLLPGEVEIITDKAELNKLYALKVREELQEIIDSDHADINEFGDLLSVVCSFASINGFEIGQLNAAIVQKENEKGTFSNLALNNLNPNNPSNKLYFEKKKPNIVLIGGSHSIDRIHHVLNEKYMNGQTVTVYPDEHGSVRNALQQLSEESAKQIIIKAPISFDDMMSVKLPEGYTISERSHLPNEPAPSARRDRRKKNRRK